MISLITSLAPLILKVGLWAIGTFISNGEKKRKAKKNLIAYWEARVKAQTGPIEAHDSYNAQKRFFAERSKKALAKIKAIKKGEGL